MGVHPYLACLNYEVDSSCCDCCMAHQAVTHVVTALEQSLYLVTSDSWALRLALSDWGSS